jgi:outer membrane lipopolysaccharide assembly protein LptE/RlpB
MAIGKKRSGQHRVIGQASDSAKAEKKRIAAQLAQKSAQENIAANRQLETARAHAATPGKANAQLTHASLISAPTPSRLKDRQKHDREMQTERLEHDSAESKLAREHSASESKLGREHQSSESKLQREHSARMQDASLWNQRQMQDRSLRSQEKQNAAERELRTQLKERDIEAQTARDAALHGYNLERDKNLHTQNLERDEQRHGYDLERNAALHSQNLTRDAAQHTQNLERDKGKYDHDINIYDIKAKKDLENWYRQQEYAEQKRIEAENRRYGIPDDANLSNEDRAKIINGTHTFDYSPKAQQEIKELEDEIVELELDETYSDEEKNELYAQIRERIAKIPKTAIVERNDSSTVFNRNTFKDDSGRIFTVDGKLIYNPADAEQKKAEQDVRRNDLRAKQYQDVILKLEQGKKVTQMVKVPGELNPKAVTVMQPYTAEEKQAILQQLFPDFHPKTEEPKPAESKTEAPMLNPLQFILGGGTPPNPMAAGGSGAQPPSVPPTPTPAPTQEAVQATLPKGFTALPPNGKGEIKILDSKGKTTQMVDSRGIMWEIIYDQSGRPIGKRRVQQPNQ